MRTIVRSISQSVQIGPAIRVDILEVDSDKRVQLRINAPRDLVVEASEDAAVDRVERRDIGCGAPAIEVMTAPRSIAQSAEVAVEEALGKPQLISVLTDVDRAFSSAQFAVEEFLRSRPGLLHLHSGLVELRSALQQARAQAQLFGDEARDLYFAASPRLTGYDTVVGQIREYTNLLDDLLFALPIQHRKCAPVIRRARRTT